MNYLLTGGTGFVGKHLVQKLVQNGHQVYILTRTPEKFPNKQNITYIGFENSLLLPPIHGIINLAGESLYGYWTKEKKQRIKSSRIKITQKLIDIMNNMKEKPNVFISGSAVGFYGVSEEKIFTEATKKPGKDFLADVVVNWEETAFQAKQLGIRTVYARFGVILGKDGGTFPLMTLPTKLFFGGRIGSGEQWTSWVHIEDVVQMLLFALHNDQLSGAYNITAPYPVRNKEFNQVLAKSLHRPYWFPTPNIFVRIATGEMSQLVLNGQYVLPKKALDYGYSFAYPSLELALKDLC
ncbi:TIGR01777 family oxidoreductase [Ornithinibacillus bavariensis]|uniref:Epimerase n=1 Tax=Ornithinibacillus bavariensis TaxID=545502 RepID=A0A919XB70_9BACI|nr:TIGR01777 family oxidoreductase [Ornithinibacillus bavariensis]GIO27855.1 epimerase [Ornithinibacillus bavariensis]HAM80368.1 TIGR01777 family protein [Ornithinibacillus sp.]